MWESVASSALGTKKLEEDHVQQVYDLIAPHFSETRYKPWPMVDEFLKRMPRGSVIADVGCGNGKYMNCNEQCSFHGSDRSYELVKICLERGLNAIVCDNRYLPYPTAIFDAVISIAVIHHLSTDEDRIKALQELVRISKVGGRILVYVWAVEAHESKGKCSSQDVMVPWHLQKKFNADDTKESEQVYHRYYHLFRQNEIDELVLSLGNHVQIIRSYYDHENWAVEFEKTRNAVAV